MTQRGASSRASTAIHTSASPSFWHVIPDLELCEARQLVRLDVGSERELVLVAVALHAGDVPLDGVEVDGQHGRLEVGEARHPVAPADTAPLRTAAVARVALAAIRSSSASDCGASRPTSSLPRAITLAPAAR